MTFIRAKQIPPRTGNYYDYEVETVHENGHVRQKVIQYIGRLGRRRTYSCRHCGLIEECPACKGTGKQGMKGYVKLAEQKLPENFYVLGNYSAMRFDAYKKAQQDMLNAGFRKVENPPPI